MKTIIYLTEEEEIEASIEAILGGRNRGDPFGDEDEEAYNEENESGGDKVDERKTVCRKIRKV